MKSLESEEEAEGNQDRGELVERRGTSLERGEDGAKQKVKGVVGWRESVLNGRGKEPKGWPPATDRIME